MEENNDRPGDPRTGKDERPFPHRYVAIEGNIGAGKTTLCQMMAAGRECRLILEQFTDNPFLPHFYQQPERYAFPVELFFLTERHKQLQESLTQPSLFPSLTVSDYYFVKTLLFARNNLNEEEFRLFQRLYHTLNNTFPDPDLLVYLHRTVPDLQRNIRHRGREFELQIREEYLQSLQEAYFNYFRTEQDFPILIIDITGVSFWQDRRAYDQLIGLIRRSYPKGVHRAELRPSVS